MTIAPATRLGPYEILSLLGSGGMGEVYRARDRKLDRDVAIKVLPEALATDSERIARFEREAKTLAALNQPHIAQIYGFEESNGIRALVMELVEGPTLADRIAQGPIPLDDALPIAKQIAEALEAAHEQGIIHRDLKPANIKVRADGTVKVLDFGLAKAFDPTASSSPGATMSPTLSIHATQAGLILGTAAYMAPEQARGKSVDKRADIWAFGCVLFELLTGRRAFDGDDVSTTLASVLKTDPDWQVLPPATPASLRRLLVRCLNKDPKDRLQAIGDARIELGELLSGATDDMAPAFVAPTDGKRRHRRAAATVTVIAAAAVGALVTWAVLHGRSVTKAEPMRFTMALPARQRLITIGGVQLALSPDGRHLAYSAVSADSTDSILMLRALDQIDAAAIKGLSNSTRPFFSPDGRWIGYSEYPGGIKKVSVTGGPPIAVCRTNSLPAGATWGPDDTIIFGMASAAVGLSAVPAGGGEPKVLTRPDTAHGERFHMFPSELPNGRAVLFTILPTTNEVDNAMVAVLDRRTGKYKVVIRGGMSAVYVDGGYLVYAAPGALRAVRFDPDRLEVSGDSVPVVDQVMTTNGVAQYAISRTGSLVYVPGTEVENFNRARRTLAWIDRRGREQPIGVPPRAYVWARLSPDGARVALDARDQDQDIWILDLARQTLTRFTFDPGVDGFPIWTPDGRQILFESNRNGGVFNVFRQSADNTGVAEQLTRSVNPVWPFSISPDGKRVILQETAPGTGRDLDLLTLDGKT